MLLGVLGAANLIIARKPEAKEIISKLAPYQGWIGVVSAFWGIWGIISSILSLSWLAYMPIYWATFLASSVLQAILGILLGIGTMKTFIKQPQAVEKLDLLVARMAPKQGLLGFIAIGTGIWMILAGFFFMSSAAGVAADALEDSAEAIAAAQAAAAQAAGQMTAEQQAALVQAQQQAVAAAGQMTPEAQAALAQAQQQAALAQAGAGAAALGQMTPEQQAAWAQQQAALAQAQGAAAQVAAQQPATAPAAPAGTSATALVPQTWPAGVDAQQQPLMGLDLYVTPPNGAPYQVRIPSFPVPAAKQAYVQPQATINVTIDPANPMNVTPVI